MKRAIFVSLLLAIVGKFAWPIIFAVPTADEFAVKELQGQIRAGFVEVSPDWDAFLKEWGDSSSKARRRAAARAIVDYASFAELATVYRVRAQLFVYVAKDAKLNTICDGTVSDRAVMSIADEVAPVIPIAGRALGRMYVGDAAWKPPVDLSRDGPWLEFAIYLNRIGKGDILDGLRKMGAGKGVSRQQQCETLGALYSLAGNRPADRMSTTSIMDFVRSIESYVLKD